MPSMAQAGVYSSVMNYLKAVEKTGSDDAEAIMKHLKSTPIDDGLFKGEIRADGKFAHEMLLLEVKKPAESTEPWDYYKVVQVFKGEEAWTTKAESKCALWK